MNLPLRRRYVLSVAVTVAAALAVITAGFNFVLANRLSHDVDRVLASRADAQLAQLELAKGHLTVREAPIDRALDQLVWVYDRGRAIERPRAPRVAQRAADRLAAGPPAVRRETADELRLLAEPASFGHRPRGTVVVAASLVPYRHARHLAFAASLALDVVLLLAAVLAAGRTVRLALAPVARMTDQAADWSEHDLDRRFALGPPRDELTALAHTLDALLGRLAASVRHEQRFSAEIAHELRTPLSGLRAEAELALRHDRPAAELREALTRTMHATDRMSAVIDTLLAEAQKQADPRRGTADARSALARAAAAHGRLAAAQGSALSVQPLPETIELDCDEEIVGRILAPLIENALRHGGPTVTLSARRTGEQAEVVVHDNGPGVAQGERDAIFEPGTRGTAARGAGAGLGLSLARRFARGAGGDLELAADTSGTRFVVTLPAS